MPVEVGCLAWAVSAAGVPGSERTEEKVRLGAVRVVAMERAAHKRLTAAEIGRRTGSVSSLKKGCRQPDRHTGGFPDRRQKSLIIMRVRR